jgi:hypothetical protein
MDTTTFTPDRTQYRALVAEVAAKAKAILPQDVNGRIESAVRLVLLADVQPQADGSILVGSSSDPMKTYKLEGSTCSCQDFVYGKAPEGWCAHKIAANLQRSVERVLARSPQALPVEPDVLPEPFPDNDPVPLPELAPAPQPASAPLPEAPVSITLKAMLHGHEVLVTLRGVDFASVRAQVEEASQWLRSQTPAPPLSPQQHHAAAMHRPITGWCAVHQVAMTLNEKDGRSWYSHRTEDGHWCKGRG